jgi:hypothetical protein
VGQRLLAEDVFVLPHRSRRDRRVEIVGGADNDGVHVLLLFEQFAVIAERGAAVVFAGGVLGSVIRVYDLLAGLAAGDAARGLQGMR